MVVAACIRTNCDLATPILSSLGNVATEHSEICKVRGLCDRHCLSCFGGATPSTALFEGVSTTPPTRLTIWRGGTCYAATRYRFFLRHARRKAEGYGVRRCNP